MKKPKVNLSGANGNVFNLGSICSNALEDAGQKEQAQEMRRKIIRSKSYDEALQVMMQYCDVE